AQENRRGGEDELRLERFLRNNLCLRGGMIQMVLRGGWKEVRGFS
ncbi:hypothetical protein A2U01_0045715, partial [Trifolium medium]|nr:hypothetical protein [Trifolium medium]